MIAVEQANNENVDRFLNDLSLVAGQNNRINPDYYARFNVKRGLRNSDGTGVLVGLTEIGDVHGYIIDENEKIPVEGILRYRGIDVSDIVSGYQHENRFGFEETSYLLLFGTLPAKEQLDHFIELLDGSRELPEGFTENMILKAPSADIMNKLARAVLASYSYDRNPEDLSVRNQLRQSIELIARFPTMAAYGYQAKMHYYDGKSLFIHKPLKGLSTSENFLRMIRSDSKYVRLEAEVLDLSLVLHAEHGGGNNSSFTTHVVTSSGTDTYSAIAAAVGSLKGPKHGGANTRVIQMMEEIKNGVKDWKDRDEIANYLTEIVTRQAFDRTGLIYGMGHAVYTVSDPRAVILKKKADALAENKGRRDEFDLYQAVESLAPAIIKKHKDEGKVIAANVDFYSGLVYSMLDIPIDLFTPIFAIARVSGWCAHRIEELISGGRIIRPAYKSVVEKKTYVPLENR
jgi:citrate synthase